MEDITYSSIVDTCVDQSGRPGDIERIKRYVNHTIREIQQLAMFANDMVTEEITSTIQTATDGSAYFTWPFPALFKRIQAVAYFSNLGVKVYAQPRRPSVSLSTTDDYYYGVSSNLVVVGKYGIASPEIAYYKYALWFSYYTEGTRPALHDVATDTWQYLLDGAYVDSLGDTEEDIAAMEAAQALVSNWLISRYHNVITSGTLAKLFGQLENETRNKLEYSLYKGGQGAILENEIHIGN